MHVDVLTTSPGGTAERFDPYGEAVAGLRRDGAAVDRAGDYLVAVVHELPQGHYEADHAGLTWREAAPFQTVRFDVAVADAVDGRFVPGLSVYLIAERDGRTLAAGQCRFHWHPRLHRYALDLRLPAGRYDITVRIGAPAFPREDRLAGCRYAEPVLVRFPGVPVDQAR